MSTAKATIIRYDPVIESSLRELESVLRGTYGLSRRAVALLLLQGDPDIARRVKQQEPERFDRVREIVSRTQADYDRSPAYAIAVRRQEVARRIAAEAMTIPTQVRRAFSDRLSDAMIDPVTGIPILLIALLVLYQFVGVLGAQTLVDFLEGTVFQELINPLVVDMVTRFVPWPALVELIVGEYGVFTLGVRYAVGLILPIVAAFFLVFSVIEDMGYLPRLALLIDRVFKRIGLNGRAVIPMVLGFGCDTMATMVTRTLETTRERVIATMLLALAIPCSAQLGVVLAILAGRPAALGIWAGAVAGVFLLIGFLAARLMPGQQPTFLMELPPLRLPRPANVLVKTYTRMEWYFLEIFPLFIFASVLIWIGQRTSLFQMLVSLMVPAVRWLGLPDETAVAFLFGFFRRDFGAAGLYDLHATGLLSGVQLTVAAVTLTLFVPCVAQFSMMLKERGARTTLAVVAFIIPFAFLAGFVLNLMLTALRISL